ncbi:MAG: DUF1934 domain-containing protein [Oscillospiraceae bacterium]|nr:DUF1934 domain-containing protein [Oscillospiraceae bacterium]
MEIKNTENAVLSVRSIQKTSDGSDESELNTTAYYQLTEHGPEIAYYEVDDTGKRIGRTLLSVLSDHLFTLNKSGFTSSTMIMETGKTHPVAYKTPYGTIDMQVFTSRITSAFNENGGHLTAEYSLQVGDNFHGFQTIDLTVQRK